MKHKYFLSLMMMFITFFSSAQTLTIQSGADFYITANTAVSVDSLVLNPSADLNLTGPQSITKTTTVFHNTANQYISHLYRFSNTVNSFSGTISIYYQDAELNGIPESELTLNVHDGTSWNAYNNGVSRDATANFVITSGLTNIGINELTLADAATALPLHWLLVEARAQNQNNEINWITTDEINVKEFQLQKCTNALSWQNAGNPIPASNTSGNHNYSYTDNLPFNPISNYRIIETDVNGNQSISKTVSVVRSGDAVFSLFPNPASERVVLNSSNGPLGQISVFDVAGKEVYTVKPDQATCMIPVAGWPSGYYMIITTVNDKRVTKSFIKR